MSLPVARHFTERRSILVNTPSFLSPPVRGAGKPPVPVAVPAEPAAASPPGGKPPHREGRAIAFRLRATAARLLPDEAVAKCGKKTHVGQVAITLRKGRAQFRGVHTCGSLWACAACAGKIAQERGEEMRALAEREVRAGRELWMAAFTIPHHRFQEVAELRWAVTVAWSKLLAGAPWARARAAAGCRGWVRSLEVTHGGNGWHPHIHAVFALDNGAGAPGDAGEPARVDVFRLWLLDKWARLVSEMGYGAVNPEIFTLERAAHLDAVADYVVKGNFHYEMTRGHMKRAKGGNRTPMQLLEDARFGDRKAGALFREFFAAFKGAKQLTAAKGFRDPHWRTDEEIAADAEGETVCQVAAAQYRRMAYLGQLPGLLDAAEDAGATGVAAFLANFNLHGGVTCPAPS